MNTDQTTIDIYSDIVCGNLVCIQQASSLTGISYWRLWRRLQREEVPTFRLRGRRYVHVSELTNPALRVP